MTAVGLTAGVWRSGKDLRVQFMVQPQRSSELSFVSVIFFKPSAVIRYQDECQVNNGGCSHHCEDQLMGFLCHCPDNMRLVGDSQCEDVDACLEADVCDQLCVHLNGNISCNCADGYDMDPTTAECKARGDEAQLVFTSAKGLRRTSLTGTETKSLGPHLSGPGPVAALVSNRTLYWAWQGRGSIYRVSVDGTSQAIKLVLRVNSSVSGLAVDWIHQLLYWTSAESGSVGVGRLDGSEQRQLIMGLDEPSAVTVEPVQGILFWAQSGSFPKIERAGMDGQDRQTLVTSAVRRPVALTLDLPRQLLYWADQGTRSISRVNLEGRERKTVVESNGYLDRPLGLAIFEGFVYWTEGVTSSVCRANKHNGGQLRVLTTDIPLPGGVVILQPVLQPNAPSMCGRPGTVCRHRCEVDLLPQSPQFSCVFPETPSNTSEEPSEPTAAEIIGLITIFSVLLLVLIVCWWRDLSGSSRPLTVQSVYLRESRDALIIQRPQMGPRLWSPQGNSA
ncbi:low-density lipoprotein receptor-like isoform X2 [Echeneis naucrates]|uniref:low-density lipoprotein receptor-like isoform X2 n=1 Tax=Echeneis naucrates TaxID=173247 RepID=UPI0011135D75|nr:low-density lipoprotein receptor-like isoform X2 [Echeneis naucrates]XP_029356080.1 low-density lipoprotein receptor-like isoform X2 [Echeneis naucrates]